MTTIKPYSPLPLHECVSFLLIKDDQVLIEQRRLDKESDPGLYAIPGGHCEVGEGQIDTLQRELMEELEVQSTAHQYVCSLIHQTTTEAQLIHYYLVHEWEGIIQCREAQAVHWISINQPKAIDITADRIALSETIRIYGQT